MVSAVAGVKSRVNNIFTIFALVLLSSLSAAGQLEYNLMEAVSSGDLEQMRELIDLGAEINQKQPPFNQTPIIIAPLQGVEIIKLLLENAAQVNAMDEAHNTALINAALYGNLDVVTLLLKNSADITIVNKDGIDAIEAARISGNQQLLDLLLNHSKQ